MSHAGKERRRRFVYLTRNTEYHTFDGTCVAVRNRNTGEWDPGHPALRRRIEGGVRTFSNGCVLPTLDPPGIGDPMYFVLATGEEDQQLVTSRVEAIGRSDRRRLPLAKASRSA